MKNRQPIGLLILLWFGWIASAQAQQTQSATQTMEELVRKTKITQGRVDLKVQKAIYIEIPSQKGYIEFEGDGYTFINSLLKEVSKKYKAEFQKGTNLTHAPDCSWESIPNAHPSTAVYRYCQFSENIAYWQTCDCAICCAGNGTEMPPVMKKSNS